MKLLVRICSVVALFLSALGAAAAEAPISFATRTPIRNDAGLTQYMVEINRDVPNAFSATAAPDLEARFHPRNTGQVENMVAAFERQYGFEATDATSWAGITFTAYLNAEQVTALRQDARVVLITELAPVDLSTVYWLDTDGPEVISWGRNAVNGKTSNGTVRVYIVDGGVAKHEDLGGVITRVNASCNPPGVHTACTAYNAVGCYAHATHVAGIIGATAGNGKGVAGVDAGAKMISVNINNLNSSSNNCTLLAISDSTIASGLDWAMWDLIANGGLKTGVINLSVNSPGFVYPGTLNAMMKTVATPYTGGYNYAGAFIAQSAGNDYQSACSHAYAPSTGVPSSSDGIMVVGGIDNEARPMAAWSGNTYAGGGAGSNYGVCVEVWAPGLSIKSTWGTLAGYSPSNPSTWTTDGPIYANYVYISGTSMAAPHITGVAAYLAEHASYTPAGLEAAVRALFYNYSMHDHDGYLMNMVRLP
jgi:hypothetical protein